MSRYAPYKSDSESNTTTDSESDSEFSTDSSASEEGFVSQGPDLSALANALAQTGTIDTTAYGSGSGSGTPIAAPTSSGFPISAGGYATFSNLTVAPDPSGNLMESSAQSVSNTVMIDSRNRDTTAFPQPTNLTLKLPRTYKMVTSFSIVQIKLLSAFFYFSAAKQNTIIAIHEIGREILNIQGVLVDQIITNTLREGTYDINSLITEITTQLNQTPIFYNYPGGFQDFAAKFSVTGDTSLNFNFPGDTYYDALLQAFIPQPTMTLIISKYFAQRYANLSTYTIDNVKIAYYYPVLKETILDPNYPPTYLNLNIVTSVPYLLAGETVTSRVIYTFQGLFDPVILELINLNLANLDAYRVQHTFQFFLINKYIVSYTTQSNRVVFQSPSLNTSLVNLLNYKANQYFTEQLNYYNLTTAQYNNLNTQNATLFAVVNDMYNFYQQILAAYFGVPFNTFTIDYLANSTFTLPIRNGLNAQGVAMNYNDSIQTTTVPAESTDILIPFRQDAPQYWNRMTGLPSTTIATISPPLPTDPSQISTISLNTWNIDLDDQDYVNQLVQSTVLDPLNPNTTPIGNLYMNRRTAYADLLVPLEPSMYTTFRFKSPVRQTLKVDTLPRPTKYRYPNYNAVAYDVSHQNLFDISYAFIQSPANSNMDVSSNIFGPSTLEYIPGFSTPGISNSFGLSYASSLAYWGSTSDNVSIIDPVNFYTFYTPFPPGAPPAPAYTYPMNLTFSHVQSTTSPTLSSDIAMFLYHDRGAFMADISANRLEVPLHYISVVSTTIATGAISTFTLPFTAYANHQYYILARSELLSFATEAYRIVPNFPAGSNYTALTSSIVGFNPLADPTTNLTNYNYAIQADPAFIQLPIASTLYGTPAVDPTVTALQFSTGNIGYDTNGVSTDLTDYIGYIPYVGSSNSVPNATIRIDPANGYIFQAKSPYNISTQTYIYPSSLNSILQPQGAFTYTPSTVAARQTSIVQWYGTTFIPPTSNQALFPENSISWNAIPPFTTAYPYPSLETYLPGYSYSALFALNGDPYMATNPDNNPSTLSLGNGVFGIGFVPSQGVWDIDRFMFKSIFNKPAGDSNLQIKYIGIFPAAITSNTIAGNIQLSNAIAVLQFHSTITYGTSNLVFPGPVWVNASNLNFGFDAAGGTFYEFTRSSPAINTSNAYLYGYNQSPNTYSFDINTQYMAVPFDSSSNIQFYCGLVGSPVPYPLYSQIQLVSSVSSPEGPIYAPNSNAFFTPGSTIPGASSVYGPPAGYTTSQYQYEQSMPIGTTAIFYENPYQVNTNSNAFNPWTPFTNVPSETVTTCAGAILTKDSVYRVYTYGANDTTRTLTESYQFTLDQVFPSASNINYLGVSANESSFAFFGLSNAVPTPYLFITTMNPATGAIQDTYSEVSPINFQSNAQLFKATYNNLGGYVLSVGIYDSNLNRTNVEVVSRSYQGTSSLTTVSLKVWEADIQYFDIGQSPKEQNGRFWVFPYRTSGIGDMFFVNPNDLFTINGGDYSAIVTPFTSSNHFPIKYQYTLSNAVPSYYRNPCVSRSIETDRIILLSDAAPTYFFEAVYSLGNTGDATIVQSAYIFPQQPNSLMLGANGGLWALLGNTLYGNRFNAIDAPTTATAAWQIFYPVQRIVFRQIAKDFSLLGNLTSLDYPEYPHTAVTVYNNFSSFTADTSNRWGMESASNFNTADYKFSGNYFNANMYAVPLEDNRTTSDYYYMTVRNYSPTEKSQVLLRVSVPNKYTFGYTSPTDLSGEISTAKYVSTSFDPNYTYYWDTSYQTSLLAFDSNFIIDSNGKIFGGGLIDGYPGSNISSIGGYADFFLKFQSLYVTFSTQVTLATTIQSNVNSNINQFILTDLVNIIPSTALTRQRYTDPLQFSIKFQTVLTPAYAKLEDSWGLGWNLGFAKLDTPYETVQTGQSFFKILDDFIILRLNQDIDINRMDTVAKEDYLVTQDSTGMTKAYYGKLLLANFGNYAQTFISNPITFTNPLGKMDRLTFQWVDATGTILNNNDCEWTAVIQMNEQVDIVKPAKPVLISPNH